MRFGAIAAIPKLTWRRLTTPEPGTLALLLAAAAGVAGYARAEKDEG